jgi:hypothetical protein
MSSKSQLPLVQKSGQSTRSPNKRGLEGANRIYQAAFGMKLIAVKPPKSFWKKVQKILS